MSKMIIEKNPARRRFISPSASTDLAAKNEAGTGLNLGWKAKAGLGLLVGAWALRRFPKATLLGAIAFGVYQGLKTPKSSSGKNPFQGEGIVKDFLH
jgi:hypothetical protein